MVILGYNFEGPFTGIYQLKDQSGVYVILDGNGKIIDVGESDEVKTRIENHERESCWKTHGYSSFAVHYTSQVDREQIEKQIREVHNPPCGEK